MCLNWRLLYPLSSNSSDFFAIILGRFLIGEYPINFPEFLNFLRIMYHIIVWYYVQTSKDRKRIIYVSYEYF